MADSARRSQTRAPLSGFARRVFAAAVLVGLLVLALMLADVTLGWRLPQPVRGWLPAALVGAGVLALTLGVGAYGAARRPGNGSSGTS